MKENLKKYFVKKIIFTGGDEDHSITESDFVIDADGIELYTEADYFLNNRGIFNYKKFENKHILAELRIFRTNQEIVRIEKSKQSITVTQGRYYKFIGRIKKIEHKKSVYESEEDKGKTYEYAIVILDCGVDLVLSIGPKENPASFKVGDYLSTEGELRLNNVEFLE